MPKFAELEIVPLADLHIGSSNCNLDNIKAAINYIKEKENCYTILNGDLMDNALKNSVSNIYEQTMRPMEQVELLIKLFEPIKEKILVLHTGNHEERSSKDTDLHIANFIGSELGIKDRVSVEPYLMFISFGMNNGRDNRKTCYSLYGTHGTGGGRTVGSKANYVSRLSAIVDADIYLHSHTHFPLTFKDVSYRSDYRNKKATMKERTYVNTNAFLNYGGYGERKEYSPTSQAVPVILLNGITRSAKVIL